MTRATLPNIIPANTSGTQLAQYLNDRSNAENSGHVGPSGRPVYATEGMIYAVGGAPNPVKIWLAGAAVDGSQDIDLSGLFADRPGTLKTTAEIRLPPGWLWADGAVVARSGTYSALYDAICPSFVGTVTNGSAVIQSVSEVLPPGTPPIDLTTAGIIGAVVEGLGVDTGGINTAFVQSVTANSITMTRAAVASAVGTTIRLLPHGNANNSSTLFNLPNCKGRVIIGRTNMNVVQDPGTITVAGAGFDGTKIGANGGLQTRAIAAGNLPPHTHPTSISNNGSSVGAEAAHTHTFADSTSTTSNESAHVHGALAPGTSFLEDVPDGSGTITVGSGTRAKFIGTTGAGSAHHHTVAVSGTTAAGLSHTHPLTLSISATSNPPTDAVSTPFNVVQPGIIENVIIKF